MDGRYVVSMYVFYSMFFLTMFLSSYQLEKLIEMVRIKNEFDSKGKSLPFLLEIFLSTPHRCRRKVDKLLSAA